MPGTPPSKAGFLPAGLMWQVTGALGQGCGVGVMRTVMSRPGLDCAFPYIGLVPLDNRPAGVSPYLPLHREQV